MKISGERLTNNLKNGIMATRTAEEISDYIKEQPWLYKFMRNCRFKGKIKKAQALEILNGKFGENTLRAGFSWTLSFEGLGYWKRKHNDFIKWYYGS